MTKQSKSGSSQKVKPRREKTLSFRFIAAFVLPIMHLLARYEVVGGEKLPKTGAYVITPNHFSNIDPLVIAIVVYKLGRAPRFLAKDSLFKVPVVSWVLRVTGQIKVNRKNRSAASEPLIEAKQITDQQSVVIVYPEGTLTRDPDLWPMRGKTGAVRLARAADIPIIPVAHWGTQDLMPRYTNKIKLLPRKTITVKFGDPYKLSDISSESGALEASETVAEGTSDASGLRASTDFVMAQITNILAELRQEEPPAKRWDPAEHGQSETGKF
ncbi:MAG: lysophospholipid acyltransferase family protein [Microbacteriaceae bacterium]